MTVLEEEEEIGMLNPRARTGGILSAISAQRNTIKPVLSGVASRAVQSLSDDDDDEVGFGGTIERTTSNSTTGFIPHHFNFVYKDDRRKYYVCNIINIPSGLNGTGGLHGKIKPKVSACGKKLEVLVSWPASFSNSVWLIESLENKLSDTVRTLSGFKKTLYNLEMEFQYELDRIREVSGAVENEPLYGMAVINQPFQCEQDIHISNTTCDSKGTVTLFVILKKKVENDVTAVDMTVEVLGKHKNPDSMCHEFLKP
jgi:hypothetical protein